VEEDQKHNDNELLLSISRGNKKAFRRLFDRFHNEIFSVAMKFTGEKQASEDAVQEIFFKLWINREKLPAILNLNAYMHKVVRNYLFNYLRKIANEQALIKKIAPVKLIPSNNEITNGLYYKELDSLVKTAVDQLPPQQKKVYNYSRIDGMKHHEIAAAMGISRSTVKGHITEALKHIKATIISNQEIDVIAVYLLVFLFYSAVL
jgi:RNA polymerase sigma-70 factor (ECF subfamily)